MTAVTMTQDEARTKWCPFARAAGYESATNRRSADGAPKRGTNCIASDCMAWRWDPSPDFRTEDIGTRGAGLRSALRDPIFERGHCGLAGKALQK